MDRDRMLRDQVINLLRGGNAHMGFDAAAADFPDAQINARPPNVAYTFWHLIEHLRLTQADILEYVTSAAYREREWPREYWPAPDAQATQADWDASIAAFRRDLDQFIAIVSAEETDLFGPVPSNAYHTGELGILRQVADAWGPGHRT
ncbi:MAG: DinB family protein [Thermomicrobiales bacterium]